MIKVGDIVLYHQGDWEAPKGYDQRMWQGQNGTRQHPAIITRVLSETEVNLTIFYDAGTPTAKLKIGLLDGESFDVDGKSKHSGWTPRFYIVPDTPTADAPSTPDVAEGPSS